MNFKDNINMYKYMGNHQLIYYLTALRDIWATDPDSLMLEEESDKKSLIQDLVIWWQEKFISSGWVNSRRPFSMR